MKKRKIRYGRVALLLLSALVCFGAAVIGVTACLVQSPEGAGASVPGSAPNSTLYRAGSGGRADLSYNILRKGASDLSKGELVLVNNEIAFQGAAPEAVSIYEGKNSFYYVKDKNVLLNPTAIKSLNRLMQDFSAETNVSDVMMISGLRSYEKQQSLYSEELSKTGQSSSTLVAKPGHSEHHTGYAVDFGLYGQGREFDGTGVYRWINENCHRYGFILRYPSEKSNLTFIDYEPWHFRYVGHPHAELIAANGFCLEEYIAYLRQFPYEGEHLQATGADGQSYELYYVAAKGEDTSVPVPASNAYRISGNNLDGFIVTVIL